MTSLKKNKNIAEIKGLSKSFGDIVAVRDVDLNIKKESIVGLVGPNGSGKTTLLKMICALINPTKGKIKVLGYNGLKDNKDIHKNIGYIPQEDSLYNDLTVLDNLLFFSKLFDVDDKTFEKNSKKLFNALGIDQVLNRIIGELSGGWKRRVAIACSLLHDPLFIVLDEPTVGLDTHIRSELWQFFKDLQREGKTILMTTHYLQEAENCDYVAIMHKGEIVAFGTPSELIKKTKKVKLKDNIKRSRFDDVYLSLTKKEKTK